ncbi:universal stress protein [Sandarakinorhabdus sp.]|jgi:nucleotide-binding universal stress UspA family protein|uniref:universal stress protein n=1 Tax=Sandarakinorhabdus sp. TaxID=1916663 RepID=UPI00333E6272
MQTAATYLVVIEDSPESGVAMRFAVQRAAHVDAAVALVSVVAPTEFLHFGSLQSAMAAEARADAEKLLDRLATEAETLAGVRPATRVLDGEPAKAILAHVKNNPGIRALVLGTATRGSPSALVSFFAGETAGSLPCILMLVPGGLEPARIADLA